MKKQMFSLCLAFLLLFCVSCSGENEGTSTDAPTSEPLFTLQGFAEKESPVRLFALQNGFFYCSETKDGVTGGFFDPARKLICESMLENKEKSTLSEAQVFPTGENAAAAVLGGQAFVILTDERSAQSFSLPEGSALSGAILYDKIGFLYPQNGLLLLSPLDLGERYVAAELDKIDRFGALLSMNTAQDAIFYAMEENGAYVGIGAIPYGKSESRLVKEISFTDFQTVGTGKFLLHLAGEETDVYTFLDAESGVSRSFTTYAENRFVLFTCNREGTLFIGCRTDWKKEGGALEFLEFEGGAPLGRFALNAYGASALALSPDGKTLAFSAYSPDDKSETIASLDVERYLADPASRN